MKTEIRIVILRICLDFLGIFLMWGFPKFRTWVVENGFRVTALWALMLLPILVYMLVKNIKALKQTNHKLVDDTNQIIPFGWSICLVFLLFVDGFS